LALIVTINSASNDPAAFSAIKGGRNGPYITYQAQVAATNAEFNKLYGVFKCTQAGLYYFSFSAMSHEGRDLRISLRVNRIPIVTAYAGSSSSYNQASASAIVPLAEGDISYLFVEDGDIYESPQVNRAYTVFNGFLISGTANNKGGFLSGLLGRDGGGSGVNYNSGNSTAGNGTAIAKVDTKDQIEELLKNQSF